MPAIDLQYHARYNNLPSVLKANARLLERHDHKDVILKMGKLILDAGLQDTIAVKLLHRHCNLQSDEIMLETFEVLEGGRPALSTVRTISATVPERVVPSVWTVGPDGNVNAWEFGGSDNYPIERTFFEVNKPFFQRVCATATELETSDLLGLSLKSNRIVVDRATQELIEVTDEQRGANVVSVYAKQTFDVVNLITTTWDFSSVVGASCSSCWTNCHQIGSSHEVRHGKTNTSH